MRLTSFASMLSAAVLVNVTGAASAASLFGNYLERGYSEVAIYARTKAQNDMASLHFARKASDAASGRTVIPDSPADTGRPLADLVEQYDAHTRLMEALAAGAADANARMAAVAQVNYDCWLAQLSAAPADPDSDSCRLLFYTALDQIAAADPWMDDIATSAGPANAAAAENDHAAGGNDNPQRVLVPNQDQVARWPISALSGAVPGEYATAAWIYLVPATAPPAPGTASGAASDGSSDGAPLNGAADDDAGGALGGAVSRTSNSLGGAVGSLGGGLGRAVGGVSGAAGGAVSSAGGTLGGPVGGVAQASGDAVSGVGGALGGAVSGVADAAGGAVSGVGGALGGALGGLGRDRAN